MPLRAERDDEIASLTAHRGYTLRFIQYQILDEEFHHPIGAKTRVSLVRPDLYFETLPGFLQRLDELHGVIRVYVVVGRSVVNHQPAFQLVSEVHAVARFVTFLILLRDPHVSLGVNRVVVIPGGWRR